MTKRSTKLTVEVCETFSSIQGESTYAGLPCFFIRLAGCNLSCSYCDKPAASQRGRRVSVARLVKECVQRGMAIAEITGGEPLIQPAFRELAQALRDKTGKPVLVETNGSCDISVIPRGVIAIMDIKTPGSGMNRTMDMANICRLRPYDEVKFVITGRRDYEWSRRFAQRHRLSAKCHAILFSPAAGTLKPRTLAGRLVKDRLPVRLQVQLHKIIGLR